ncbi:Uncharacterised protein [Mycobacteroides abscessus subsp. abscessus]|nr:Uncharacterised protein [Mycobacteroides abscessus subsp. abscessus]SII33330.1 Uncharacterised protein [Mycobacteroides abscessus subsp. abscessus]SII65580.1 Uncharacterised protein [Mycobacteroides abscessus subsp. abscessus]
MSFQPVAAETEVASARYLEEVGRTVSEEYVGVYQALASRR